MKKIAIAFFATFIWTSVSSQLYTEQVFLNIWNEYRSSINSTQAHCDFQHYYGFEVTPTHTVLIYKIGENGDTLYRYIECTGDKKVIPTYHDKNTSSLIKSTCTIPLDSIYDDAKLPLEYLADSIHPMKARRYLDSLALNKVFKGIIESSENETIISSNYNFYVKINKVVSKDQLNMVYTIQIFEILDVVDTSISFDYASTYVKGNFEKLKPYIVDESTKKLKY